MHDGKILKSIDFVFENLEEFHVEQKDIRLFSMHGIKEWFYAYEDGTINRYKVAEALHIIVSASGDGYTNYAMDFGKDENAFTRMTRIKDLVALELHYDDDERELIYVEYEDNDADCGPNIFEIADINHDGELIIAVSKDYESDKKFVDSWMRKGKFKILKE